MKNHIILNTFACASVLLLSACNDEWLEPRPLSFYTPENTFVDPEGFESVLSRLDYLINDEYNGDGCALVTELVQSDLFVEGTTDKAGPQMDMDKSLLPDANLESVNYTKVGWYWRMGHFALKNANVIISRIDEVSWSSQADRNRILGQAYFHRAYWYYKLVHQFGDVPFMNGEVTEAKVDFYSNDRWSILAKLKQDLDFAWENVPDKVDRGSVGKGACGLLLMKIDIELGRYDEAIEIGKSIVAAHPLMTQRFSSAKAKHANLMFDLHSNEGKLDPANTEGLYCIINYPNQEGSIKSKLARNMIPYLPSLKMGGKQAIKYAGTLEIDYNPVIGAGVGRVRPTSHFQWGIWTDKERNDIRGQYNRDSWRSPDELQVNFPGHKNYGSFLVKQNNISVEDSIRSWYQWPVYKTFAPDPLAGDGVAWWGGEIPIYIYRSAEAYLVMAEACYWKGDNNGAASYLNEVRRRSGADDLSASDINIGAILDERARELCYEESRHVELVRIAYTYAKSGKTCEYFGRSYKLENFSGPGGTGSNVKEAGYNFFWDWVNEKNNFYNKGVKHRWAEYKMSVHHVLWPIPSNAISANTQGVINQNIGYPGAEKNVTPRPVE